MLWSIRYRLLCWLLRLLVPCGLDELDLENAVLRHQLKVLRRGGRRVLFTTADRAFLAAAARVPCRELVGPDTLARRAPWPADRRTQKRRRTRPISRRRTRRRCRCGAAGDECEHLTRVRVLGDDYRTAMKREQTLALGEHPIDGPGP